jgi:hypothetical protein
MVATAEQDATIDPPTKFDIVVALCGVVVGVVTVIAVTSGWL